MNHNQLQKIGFQQITVLKDKVVPEKQFAMMPADASEPSERIGEKQKAQRRRARPHHWACFIYCERPKGMFNGMFL